MRRKSATKKSATRTSAAKNPGDLVQAARRVVAEHGRDFEVLKLLPQSAWTPVVAPLVAAGLSSINQPHIETAGAADDPLDRSLEIPIPEHLTGPMTRARQRRLTASFATAQLAGLASVLFEAGPAREAWATGVMFPGAGFVYTRDPGRFAITATAFGLAGVLWFGTGNHILPPLVWGGSAAIAARRAARGSKRFRAAPYVVAATTGLMAYEQLLERRRRLKAQREQGIAANALLKDVVPPLRGADRPEIHTIEEMDDITTALSRRFVDMAHRPMDDWRDWDVLDQFQTAAIRYQVDHMIYTLALQKYTRTPAFRGYQDEAMRRLVQKYQQKRVWSYWAYENLWGNFEWNPDPARKQNIMLTGFFALSLGAFQTVTGDLRHSKIGSIEFVWSEKRRYPYSYESLCSNLTGDYLKSPWGLVVCEPNWIFSPCNMRGAAGLIIHDRLHGTHYWDMIKDGYYRGLEQEFVRPDGTLNFYRSARTGIGLNGASFSTDLRPMTPHLADRGWALLRAAFEERDGELVTPLADRERLLDTGNYAFHPLKAYAYIIEEAREAGDEEAARAAWTEVQQRIDMKIDERGWLVVDGASMAAHLGISRSLNGRKSGWLDLIQRGMPDAWAKGPQLESVPYPGVFVTRAVNDGDALETVLRPTNGGGRFTVELSQLRPAAEYRVTGATAPAVVADDQGRASLEVELAGRQELRIVPAL
jgi:hypothetical protein